MSITYSCTMRPERCRTTVRDIGGTSACDAWLMDRAAPAFARMTKTVGLTQHVDCFKSAFRCNKTACQSSASLSCFSNAALLLLSIRRHSFASSINPSSGVSPGPTPSLIRLLPSLFRWRAPSFESVFLLAATSLCSICSIERNDRPDIRLLPLALISTFSFRCCCTRVIESNVTEIGSSATGAVDSD